jgi:hypothetical protein
VAVRGEALQQAHGQILKNGVNGFSSNSDISFMEIPRRRNENVVITHLNTNPLGVRML